MTTPHELAALLNGREYRHEITTQEALAAKDAGLVVVFGYSDDYTELRGALHDEAGACRGAMFKVTSEGLLTHWDRHEQKNKSEALAWFRMSQLPSADLESVWGEEGYSWTFRTSLPHATFDIMEDGEKFCRGIVFSIESLK